MDDRNTFIHDAYISMAERTIKRQWITIILLILLLFGSWIGFIYYESQFTEEETTTIEATQDGDGLNMVSGGDLSYEPDSKAN